MKGRTRGLRRGSHCRAQFAALPPQFRPGAHSDIGSVSKVLRLKIINSTCASITDRNFNTSLYDPAQRSARDEKGSPRVQFAVETHGPQLGTQHMFFISIYYNSLHAKQSFRTGKTRGILRPRSENSALHAEIITLNCRQFPPAHLSLPL